MPRARTMKRPDRLAVRATALVCAGMIAFTLVGCGLQVPTDPDGTLDAVTGGDLRVGASVEPDLIEENDGAMTGSLAGLVEDFADTRQASVDWTIGSEESLVAQMENGELDLIVGGMTDQTLWSERVAVTRGYTGIPSADGRGLVMFVPLGENRMLSTLERFLDGEVAE